MAWFARDYTGRVLSSRERTFLDVFRALLTELRPPQLDPHDTVLTAEGSDCLIAILPHRGLGGVAMVVTLGVGRAEISWTQVRQLDLHDDLDAGVPVAHFRCDIPEPDFRPVLQSVREQFAAPVTLRCYDADRATAHIADHAGVLRRIGEVGGAVGWLERLGSAQSYHEATVRFTDEGLPPVTAPAGVDSWFAPDGGGA